MTASSLRIGEYLIQQLYSHGVRHIFGVPGDYILSFFHQIQESPIQIVNTCDEQGAGFAADAYARIRGVGAVCVTYCVGGLEIANTTAEAFAEKSPVVVISGAPGTNERTKNPLLHHKVRDFDTQHKVFEQLTVASAVLNDPATAFREIDRVLAAAMQHKRPVYLELPRDTVSLPGLQDYKAPDFQERSDPEILSEALSEAVEMINGAKKPAIIAGIEIHRFGLHDEMLRFIDKTQIPVASTLLSKSVISEKHPLYLGVYEGAMGREDVRDYIESSDCLILLGAPMSDVDLGIFTARLNPSVSISVTREKASIRYHNFEDVRLADFLHGLIQAAIMTRVPGPIPHPQIPPKPGPATKNKITVEYLFQRLNSFLEDDTVVIADPGDAMFAGADLFIHGSTEFISPAYYTSMGFAVPASLGVQLANPKFRPLVLVGDGAFQMTGMELSTIARYGLNPIVVVLNNKGYGTERPMQDGPFNDIGFWKFSRIPEIIGAGKGFEVQTEIDLEKALSAAHENTGGFSILDVHLEAGDYSPASRRLTASLGKKVQQYKS